MGLWFFCARRNWFEGPLCRWKRHGCLFPVRHGSSALQCRGGALGTVTFRREFNADCLRTERPPLRRWLDAKHRVDALLPQMEAPAFLVLGVRLRHFDRAVASYPLHLPSATPGP